MSGLTTVAEKFIAALFATTRAAFSRFVAERGLSLVDSASKAAARSSFDAQLLLADSDLVGYCRAVLGGAVGPETRTVAITVWQSLYRTFGGQYLTYDWAALASQHAAWGQMVSAKGDGAIYNPTLTGNGARLTEHTRSVSTLVLDCDGTGTWDALWDVVAGIGLAAITHESGGYTPTAPKWRVLIPLTSPFDTSSPDGGARWRSAYAAARVVFGTLARLRGAGFDPMTDLVNNAWFPGYRRTEAAEPRRVLYSTGASLDLHRLVALVPAPAIAPVGLTRRAWMSASPSLLELAFEEAGLLGPDLGRGRSAVTCPWNDCHTNPLASNVEPTSATVLFPSNSSANVGAFFCAHTSCGSKPTEEVFAMLPADAVHRARLRHARADTTSFRAGSWSMLPRLPVRLPMLPKDLP